MNEPSRRSRSVRHFLVMEILERAQELEAAGEDVVHLEVGEPDFATPETAVSVGISSLRAGKTHYTHSLGIPPLREQIALRLSKETGADIGPDRVVVTMGSSAGLLLSFAALADVGDEIVVTDPGYPCYANIARTLGINIRPVPVGAETGFLYDPKQLERHIGDRTKAIVVNSPANPTGVVTDGQTLHEIAALGVDVVSDEIYRGLVYEGTAPSFLSVDPEAFVVGGFSKQYAMTGWRIGYVVVPTRALRVVQAMQQNLYISASDFGQWAALAALEATQAAQAMRRHFDERRRYLLDALPPVGLPVPVRPAGAFYAFADVSKYSSDSMSLALDVLDRARVAVAPGIDFGTGGEGFIRISYATSLDRIQEGVRRLSEYFSGG